MFGEVDVVMQVISCDLYVIDCKELDVVEGISLFLFKKMFFECILVVQVVLV